MKRERSGILYSIRDEVPNIPTLFFLLLLNYLAFTRAERMYG